jgi:hypothetical protein
MSNDPKLDLFRHTLATLAYRGGKAVRQAPPEFAEYKGCERTPAQILAHLGDLLDWALSMAEGKQRWKDSASMPWDQEVARFFASLKAFDDFVASGKPLAVPMERLFQGPVADALTHVGQIAMMRRMAGSATYGENYFMAEVTVGRVGEDQAKPGKTF